MEEQSIFDLYNKVKFKVDRHDGKTIYVMAEIIANHQNKNTDVQRVIIIIMAWNRSKHLIMFTNCTRENMWK